MGRKPTKQKTALSTKTATLVAIATLFFASGVAFAALPAEIDKHKIETDTFTYIQDTDGYIYMLVQDPLGNHYIPLKNQDYLAVVPPKSEMTISSIIPAATILPVLVKHDNSQHLCYQDEAGNQYIQLP